MPEGGADAQRSAATAGTAGASAGGGRPTILVADADRASLTFACRMLGREGFETVTASDGREVIAKLLSTPPDMVVVDAELPNGCGFEICEDLRRLPGLANLPAVIVTSRDDPESIVRAYRAGATDFITKPVSWIVFGHRIRYMLRASRSLAREEEARLAAQEARLAAEAASQSKLDFLANVSHEIRTPMAAILGYLELLFGSGAGSADGEEQRVARESVERNAHHLLQLLDDILDVARQESGELRIATVECCPVEAIVDAIEALRPAASAKGLALSVDADPTAVGRIWTDPRRVRQIVTNLVSNAVKFTERGGVSVHVARITDAAVRGDVEIVVADSGIGMTPDRAAVIFQPFTQADESVARSHGGTGLGLTIVRGLAGRLGGAAEVTSQLGIGSRFRVTLSSLPENAEPLSERPAQSTPAATLAPTRMGIPKAAEREPAPQRDAALDAPTLRPGCRVLVVEDSVDNQRLLRRMLELAGASVTVAPNGRVGVEAVLEAKDREPFDVILMDMQMPVLDGYSATAELRALGCASPILALTAHAGAGDRARCLAAGCDDFMTKPVRLGTLVECVHSWLEKTDPDV